MNTIRHAIAMVALGAGVLVGGHSVARAETENITVSNKADDGSATSLRGVIDMINAEGGDWNVRLQGGIPYILNRDCQDGDLDDNHGGDFDLVANGTVTFRSATVERATIAVVCAGERAFDHSGAGVIRFDHVRITGGNTANGANGLQAGDRDGQNAQGGGAIRSAATVELVFAEIDGNSTGRGGHGAPPLFAGSGGEGGHGGSGGAIQAFTISALASSIHHNTTGAGGNGGNSAGANQPAGDGGDGGHGTLIGNGVELSFTEVSDNALGQGGSGGQGTAAGGTGGDGGVGGVGGGVFGINVELDASTIAHNAAGPSGNGGNGVGAAGGHGANAVGGGGLRATNATVLRSTIHGNDAGVAGLGGGGAPPGANGLSSFGGGVLIYGAGSFVFSTITANTAAVGANLYAPAATVLRASVIGDAQGGVSCNTAVVNQSYTVNDEMSCGGPAFTFASLELGPLTDNGGYTRTRLPLVDSPIVGLIPDDVCPDISTMNSDQRLERRPNWRCEPGAVELPSPAASKFVAVPPARVFDTRVAGPSGGFVAAGTTRTVQFAGVAGIPSEGVTAVAFNLTIDAAGGAGFVTVSPTGWPQTLASSLNTVRAGQTVPNLVIVPLGSNGRLDFFAQRGGHLLGDVVGYYSQTPVASDGRTISLDPARLFDTREPGPASGKLAAGGTLTVQVTGAAGVPATGVSAVILNLTGTDATAAGYVSTYPGNQAPPLASTLNLDGPGHTSANLTIVPVAPDGTISFFSQSGVHLVADVTAYVTDGTAPVAAGGLFVPIQPTRAFDTRIEGAPIAAGGTIHEAATVGDIQGFATAVIFNLTATEAAARGYVTGWAHGDVQPLASNLNLNFGGETRANAALLPVGDDGEVAFFSQSGTHLLADAFGYLLPDAIPLV